MSDSNNRDAQKKMDEQLGQSGCGTSEELLQELMEEFDVENYNIERPAVRSRLVHYSSSSQEVRMLSEDGEPLMRAPQSTPEAEEPCDVSSMDVPMWQDVIVAEPFAGLASVRAKCLIHRFLALNPNSSSVGPVLPPEDYYEDEDPDTMAMINCLEQSVSNCERQQSIDECDKFIQDNEDDGSQ